MLCTYVRVANLLTRLRPDERGVTAVEYSIMAAVIAIGLTAAFWGFESKLATFFSTIDLSGVKPA